MSKKIRLAATKSGHAEKQAKSLNGFSSRHVDGNVSTPKLPHEHDESTKGETATVPDPLMIQAKKDNKNGIVDTDRRSAYGLSEGLPNKKRHKG